MYRKKNLRSNNELKKYLKENPAVKCATNVTSTHLPFDLKVQKITLEVYIEIEMRLQINLDLKVEICTYYFKKSLMIFLN